MKNKGLTLLELIIAISVLSIMLTMAAPSFNNLFASNTMKRTSSELRGLIVAAKSEAVMRGTDVYLHRACCKKFVVTQYIHMILKDG